MCLMEASSLEVLRTPSRRAKPVSEKAGWSRPRLGEVVMAWQELFWREVAGDAEDDEAPQGSKAKYP